MLGAEEVALIHDELKTQLTQNPTGRSGFEGFATRRLVLRIGSAPARVCVVCVFVRGSVCSRARVCLCLPCACSRMRVRAFWRGSSKAPKQSSEGNWATMAVEA